MRVLVVTSAALFVRGGHLVIAEETVSALRRAGHQADLLVTPQNRFGRQGSAYLATWLTDVGMTADGHPIDRVISFRFPSYAVRHPQHVCWLNHRMREYYDLWETFAARLSPAGRLKESVRRGIFHVLDGRLLGRRGMRVVAQSRTIQSRLLRFGGIKSDVLHPPAPERPYRTDGYGDYIFAVSRLDPLKRLDLLIEAAALVKSPALRFKIAGSGPEEARLRARVHELNLGTRVELLGQVSDDEMIDHLARCRAVFFAPRDEDYGLVTLQAFRSAKAVVTGTDSGGPTELIEDGRNGCIVSPQPPAVATCLDRLAGEGSLAEEMGQRARSDAQQHTWARAVAELVPAQPAHAGAQSLPANR
jgi:glycosyltransferase involved in cell wall biosynthesis